MSGASWFESAKCRGTPTQDFYPESTTTPVPREVQRLCDTCPVQGECLSHALIKHEAGIWGGTTEAQRKAILSRNLRRRCLRCNSMELYKSKRFMVCLFCGVSWRIS